MWHLFERRRREAGKSVKKGATPMLPILDGHDQPGPHQKRCYNCGLTGHIGSDPVCKAGPNDVWKGAPASYKQKRQGGKPKGKGGGKPNAKGGTKQRNARKRKSDSDFSKIACHNWSRGNGFCKYDDNCRYSHDGPKGDKSSGKKETTKVSLPVTKKQKKNGNKTALVITDDREFIAEDDDSSTSGDHYDVSTKEENDHLYELIRGVPTVVIQSNETHNDFIPINKGYQSNVVVTLKTKHEPSFVVTLPIFSSSDEDEKEFIPIDAAVSPKAPPKSPSIGGLNNETNDKYSGMYTTEENKVSETKSKRHSDSNFSRKGFSLGKQRKESKHSEKQLDDVFSLDESPEKRDILTKRLETLSSQNKDLKEIAIDLKLELGNAQQKFKKSRNASSAMKTSIRRIVSVKRDIKGMLAVLTDADVRVPRARKDEISKRDMTWDNEGFSGWTHQAYNATPDDEWLIIKVPMANKTHFMCDFCDGDELDEFEWLEGVFKQGLTIRELLEYRRERSRAKRRNITDPLHTRTQPRIFASQLWERHSESTVDSGSEELDDESNPSRAWINDFRGKIKHYHEKPDLADLFQNAKRKKENDLSQSSSNSDSESTHKNSPIKEGRSGSSSSSDDSSDPDALMGSSSVSNKKRKRRSGKKRKQRVTDPVKIISDQTSIFKCGQMVTFDDDNVLVSGVGIITKVVKVENPSSEHKSGTWFYEIDCVSSVVPGPSGWVRQSCMKAVRQAVCLTIQSNHQHSEALHPLDHVGIDTCAAMSVSTERDDFLYLDCSKDALESVELNGIGGGDSKIGGRGPMIVTAKDTDGNTVYMDPAGVFLISSEKQSRLRIYGQQRMKGFGFYVQQNKFGDGEDYWVYKSERLLKMATKRGILMVKTEEPLSEEQKLSKEFQEHVQNLLYKRATEYCFDDAWVERKDTTGSSSTTLIVNEAKLTRIEKERLDHWRSAHRTTTGDRFNERCSLCEKAKHKASFKRNPLFNGTSATTSKPYWRLYADGYGGQQSMGDISYQGATGGFVFVCPVSGRIKVRLYATTAQYPAILYQILQEIESEGYSCRELYYDTHSVNLSAAAEEVAGMF
jgi:hypothetical protein